MNQIAIHFGTGALGRGLVIPYLSDSGYEIIAVDTDRKLAAQLNHHKGYDILQTDTGETQHIALRAVLHPEDPELLHWLNQAGATVPQTFEITQNIAYRFQEKRVLVNTYADGISFLGAATGLNYLYEAAVSEKINADIADYMQLAKRFLQLECDLEAEYLDRMSRKHRQRLANPHIQRELSSVARNFLEKIRPDERFIFPLNELLQRGIDVSSAMPFLNKLICSWAS
jgi:mannitol-1-phosphate/altronate dehydrogenase